MGRKKKGEFSREAILQKAIKAKEDEDSVVVKDVACTTKKRSSASQAKAKKPDAPVRKLLAGIKASSDIIDETDDNEDVFDDDYNVKYEDDILELTRLMSVCDIADDPIEFQKQLNLAGIRGNHYWMLVLV